MNRKLIEVALPLEAINGASAREKSVRQGNPSTVHLWWARRPFVAARAIIFAQLVDDPSARPDEFPTAEAQIAERQRLFRIIERLVLWENTRNTELLAEANAEIRRSARGVLPRLVDPFAGGGAIPLEAQRLGVEVEATDLNPVAVLINRSLLDLPRRWRDMPPVHPGAGSLGGMSAHTGALGMATDVRLYGAELAERMRDDLSGLYPALSGSDQVIARLWARTVECPNPACRIRLPLARSWWLRKKRGKEAFLVPNMSGAQLRFKVSTGPGGPTGAMDGTVSRTGATCPSCHSSAPLSYIREEGRAHRIGFQLLATVIDGGRGRKYVEATAQEEEAAGVPPPEDAPDTDLPESALGFRVQGYGMTRHAQLFTPRQLVVLTVMQRLIREVCDDAARAARSAGMPDGKGLQDGGSGAIAYSEALRVYLALALDRVAMSGNTLCRWNAVGEKVQHLFGRQAISMLWDFAEANPLGTATGSVRAAVAMVANGIEGTAPEGAVASVAQSDAAQRDYTGAILCTDPPYYDNVGYADLADFFYVWLRPVLQDVYPDVFQTVLTPKDEELIANPFRQGGPLKARDFFESGFQDVFWKVREGAPDDYPMTLFYAFKQSQHNEEGEASTGWETLLSGLMSAGWSVTATWPIRTEMATRMRGLGSNALASSIVLSCRPRSATAGVTTRRGFLQSLRAELPGALRDLQQGSVAPVDLTQATIGPGMGMFTRHNSVVEADGSAMTVRTALALINQVLDEVLAEQEGDFDADTRFCVKWFSQFGWDEAAFGRADELSRSTNTAVDGLVRGGVFWARAGKARLLAPEELSGDWDPVTDERVSVWEVVVRVAAALAEHGVDEAARLMALAGRRVDLDTAKELAYLLFSVCEKRGWTQSALMFNGLGTSWLDLSNAARSEGVLAEQGALDLEEE